MSEAASRLTRASEPAESHTASSESKTDTACDSLLGTVKSTFDPFKETFSSEGGAFHHVSEAVNALASVQGMPSQLLNTGIAQIPLLDKMPGMPAATIGVPHLGTPHAHAHPPSNGFPLPSVGLTIGSGCLSVLIGGIPAARVLDIGYAPTCGGLTPYFDIQTGSSNTFIGGMRAARMGIDMTRHCNPTGHVGKSGGEAASAAEKSDEVASEAAQVTGRAKALGRAGKAWSVGNAAVGPASGVATAADDVSQGEIAAAAMMAAQTAADLVFMMLSNMMGKDPGVEPSMGTLLLGDPTVLIGGFPLPDSQMMWHGAKHGIGKKVRPKLPKWAQKLACELWGEPVSAVTGEVENDFTDYETDEVVPFRWGRHYSSSWHDRDGVMGYGFRHTWQHELRLLRTRAVYINPRGTEHTFPKLKDGTYGGSTQGYALKQHDGQRFTIHHGFDGNIEFKRGHRPDSLTCVSHTRNGVCSLLNWGSDQRIGKITQYDQSGQIRRLVSLWHDQSGRIVKVVLTNADGRDTRVARYEYDSRGCLTSHLNALNAVSTCEYDVQRRMLRWSDANGYSFFYRYNSEGRCVESKGQDGLWHVQLQYSPGRTTVTEDNGGTWTVFHDKRGAITRVVDPFGDAAEYALGSNGRIESEIDSGGRIIRWIYDESGRNTGRLDRWGNLWPIKDLAPLLPDRPLHVMPGTPMERQWGKLNLPSSTGKLLLPPQIEMVAATISCHLIGTMAPPVEKRDATGRILERTGEDSHTEYFQYDAGGNVTAWRDRDGREFCYEIASRGLPVAETDPLGNVTRYRYTSKEQIQAIVDPNGNESLYTYDHKGRITSVMRHGVVRETYTYNAANLLSEKRDSTGNVLVKFEAGTNSLYQRRTLASGESHIYDYDARGNTTRASTDTDDITLEYDRANRLTSDKRNGLGVEHEFSGERLTRTTYFGRFAVRYEFVNDSEIRIHTPEGQCHRLQWSADKKVLLEAANGTTILSCFDCANRSIGQIAWRQRHEEQAHCIKYQYSATGELRFVISDACETREYQYDAAHRLTEEYCNQWPVRKYAYDRAGNLLSTPEIPWMHYSEGNRLASSSLGTFRYDDRNHLTEFTSIRGVRTWYQYNSKDLLVKVSWNDRPEEWGATYDGLCRRIYQEYDKNRTNYYWDGVRLAAEIGFDGRLRLYIYPNESSLVPFLFIDYLSTDAALEDGLPYLVFSNQVGLPQWIQDGSGSVAWIAADIDPYGKIQIAKGNVVDYNLRFPGHYFDAATGLHYNRFRSYSPELGRYLQSDPIGQSGGTNLYAYVANPVVMVDVFGLKEPCGTHDSAPDPEAEAPKARPPIDLERSLQALRNRLNRKIKKEIRTAGVGVSDVPGFEAVSDVPGLQSWIFEVWSPRVRRALNMTTTPGPIHSPYSHPFKEHAEEEFGNQFILALKEVGYTEDKNGIFHAPTGTARLLMNASPVGCCSICLLDLRSDGKNVGVVKQLSQKVPNVKFIFETDGHPNKTITVLGGKILK